MKVQVDLGEIGAKKSSIFGFWHFVSGSRGQLETKKARRIGRALVWDQPPVLGSTCVTMTVFRGCGRSAKLMAWLLLT